MRLVDCFSELFYYTLFLKSIGFGQMAYDDVRKHYSSLFKRVAQSARDVRFQRQDFEHALFATVAWIDETVLESSWEGRAAWMKIPLQLQLFHTASAGEEFYTRLEGLGGNTEVRRVFDYCLALGFRGRYFRQSDEQAREQVIRDNIRLMKGDQSLTLPKRLFPEAYAWESEKPPRPRRLAGNAAVLVIAVVLPLLFLGGMYLYYAETLTRLVMEYFNTVL